MRNVREASAGGVIYRRYGGALEIALIRVRNRWSLPKGHIEEGESTAQTAVREVREETGLEGRVSGKLGEIRYTYRGKTGAGEPLRINKRVYFYLLRYVRGNLLDHDQEVDEARWVPIYQALRELKFPSEKKMVRRALSILSGRDRRRPAAVRNPPA